MEQTTKKSFDWKRILVFCLMAAGLWFAYVAGSSFVRLTGFIYRTLGWGTVVEGAFLMYFGLIVIAITFTSIDMVGDKNKSKERRFWRRIIVTWSLIPGLSFLLPLAGIAYCVFMLGIKGSAWLIVFFENIYKDDRD